MTLASHETPEQPSPRTAQSQTMFSPNRCKFLFGAGGWHEIAIVRLYLQAFRWLGLASLRLDPGYCSNRTRGHND